MILALASLAAAAIALTAVGLITYTGFQAWRRRPRDPVPGYRKAGLL